MNVFVAGSAVIGQTDYRATIKKLLRERAERHP